MERNMSLAICDNCGRETWVPSGAYLGALCPKCESKASDDILYNDNQR